jgi:predicted nucleic acid-binding protein
VRRVLDAGAIVALERGDRALWAVLKSAASSGTDVIVPSTVIAQTWRRGARQALLARALASCVVAAFDAVVYEVGELCGRARTSDVCDAHVALVAATRGDVLYTSDPGDLRRLLVALGARVALIRC